MRLVKLAAAISLAASACAAGPLEGKRYIIELTSSQYASGYGDYLVPPLYEALERAGLHSDQGEGAELVVNIITDYDVGQWMGEGAERAWIHTFRITVGISPAGYNIPLDGTPVFGARATLLTPNPDREDELDCMIRLAARAAVANYQPSGFLEIDGQRCLRQRPFKFHGEGGDT
jgi:hypothetical protein